MKQQSALHHIHSQQPTSSDFSLTPRSGRHLEFKESKTPILGQRAVPESAERVKDMIATVNDVSNYARGNLWKFFLALGVGLGAGLLLNKYGVSEDLAAWIALPGTLFVSALKALIVPVVFCSVVVSVGDLLAARKVSRVGTRTVVYFAMGSLMSSLLGVIFGIAFLSTFEKEMAVADTTKIAALTFKCFDGSYLAMAANGTMSCTAQTAATDSTALLLLNDTTGFFTTSGTTYQKVSVSEQIIAILLNLVPENVLGSFANSLTVSVITFAICFSIASVRSVEQGSKTENYVFLMLEHLNVLARMMINAVVSFIPFAIVSLVAAAVTEPSTTLKMLEGVGYLILSLVSALTANAVVVMGLALYLTTGRNILSYLKHIVPAQIFVLSCASSVATLPLTMRCVDASREVSHALSRVVLSLGAASNFNGTAVYMPLVCIFMAKIDGYEDMLTPGRYALLCLVGAVTSFGVAAVPHAGLVMVITVWRTVFGMDVPPSFALLVGTDWILDRLRSIVNITNDTVIARIIASQCHEASLRQQEITTEAPMSPESPKGGR